MSNVKFELNLQGLNELMKSPEMAAVVNDAAARIAAAAGDGYEVEAAHPLSFDNIGSVRAATYEAYYDALENGTLEKALGGVRV